MMSSTFECTTCHEASDDRGMMKHLSSTRHKTVLDMGTTDEVNCEECSNNNIHQLQIIRFGGDDIRILCNSCFNKEYSDSQKPSTSYSLSNGSILSYWDNYVKVRDCQCVVCEKDTDLNVNSKKKVLCTSCLQMQEPRDINDYVSEDSGKFLFIYLGIKETSNNKTKKVKRKVGRKKNMRKPRVKKPLTVHEQMAKNAYETKKQNNIMNNASSVTLSSFKGIKASNSSTSLQKSFSQADIKQNTMHSTKSRSPVNINTIRLSPMSSNFKTSTKSNKVQQNKGNRFNNANKSTTTDTTSNQQNTKKTQSSSNNRNTKSNASRSPDTSSNQAQSKKKNNNNDRDNRNNSKNNNNRENLNNSKSNNNRENLNNSKNNKNGSKPSKIDNNKSSTPNNDINNSNSRWAESWTTDSTKNATQVSKKSSFQNVRNGTSNSNKKAKSLSTDKKPKENKIVKNIENSNWSKGMKATVNDPWSSTWDSDPIEPKKTSNNSTSKALDNKRMDSKAKRNENSNKLLANDKKDKNDNSKQSITKESNMVGKQVNYVEEGVRVQTYNRYKATLSYENLSTYFADFSYAMFLEEKLETQFVQNFSIMWPKDRKEKCFVLTINAKNNPEIDRIVPPNLQRLGRKPFVNRQPIMLCTQDEKSVWYTYVKETADKKGKITLLLELYFWNPVQLPINGSNEEFKILPCSPQTTRILFSMAKIDNPNFINLILGKNTIKQVEFKNRLTYSKDTFNESQKSTIQHVLNNDITIVQGPPGTGKTSTIEEIIIQMIKSFNSFPILVVAASNIAIDNIAEKFIGNDKGIRVLRVVSEAKESEYRNDHPLAPICLHHIVYNQLSPNSLETLAKLKSGNTNFLSKNAYNKFLDEKNKIADRYVSQAQIIFTTNIAAGGRNLKGLKELPVVIMDESTQSSEAATLVPLSLPGIKTFVFVGDEKQLSTFSNVPQLEMSLFERVLLNGRYTNPHMLDTQYRMHPQISEFPIKTFYNGELKDGVTSDQRSRKDINYPLYFYDFNRGPESRVSRYQNGMSSFTYTNGYEAREILKILYKLILDKKVSRSEISIITPYSAQRDLISEILEKDPVVNPDSLEIIRDVDEIDLFNSRGNNNTAAKTINIINGIYIATIDSFQGHENNFIIFSCVRSNNENKVGFVSDRRRMNVALTRARNGLIIVGNARVLSLGSHLWKSYVNYVEKKKLLFKSFDDY